MSNSGDSDGERVDAGKGAAQATIGTGTGTTRVVSVVYCPVCGGPYEFCAWDPRADECKAALKENVENVFPDVKDEAGLLELLERLGLDGKTAGGKKKKGGSQPKTGEDGAAEAAGKKGKKKEAPSVLIELNNRNKKKFVTVVKGLESFGVDLAPAAKVFGKKFACGAALQKGKNGLPDQIEIQGNYRDELPGFIQDKYEVSMSSIYVMEDGKKVSLSEL